MYIRLLKCLVPLDETALDRFSAEQVASMSEREKKFEMKLAPVHLELLKVTGVWKIISYGELLSVLDGRKSLLEKNIISSKTKQK